MGSSISLHTQQKRLLRLVTPLGEATLVPLAAEGEEVMSAGFTIAVTAFSELRHDLQPRDLVGQMATLVVIQEDQTSRYFNGYITELTTLGRSHGGQRSSYQLTLKPWLHFLDQCADCRIFQELSVPDVLKQLFAPLRDVARYTFDLQRSHEPYRYLTQYNESTGNFMRRLLAMDGIGFLVEHDNGVHTVRFFDNPEALPELAPERILKLQSDAASHDRLAGWSYQGRFTTGRFVQRTYNYKEPSKLLQGESDAHPDVLKLARAPQMERYTYAECYVSLPGGNRHTNHVMGGDTERHQTAIGHGTYRLLQPGRHFSVKQVPSGEWVHNGADFTFTRVAFSANDSAGDSAFEVRFEALPKGEMVYPRADQPLIASLQSARVTGPVGEELFTDDLGRVKVVFHWDRDEEKPGENATCWLRVMQSFAGPGFGAQFTPRIGQEVVVAFENGNPDRPFVLGALYHAEHEPPYAGHNGSRSGIRTRSTKGGGAVNCNELYFEDALGKEELFIQAERDLNGVIKRNENRRVGNDQEIEVKHDKIEKVGNNAKQTVAQNLIIEAGASIILKVGSSAIEITGGKILVRSGVVDIDGSSVQVN